MGACCSCGLAPPQRTPQYFYCQPILDEHTVIPFTHSTHTTVSSGVLVDTNLDTSSPDTYRAPPLPLPYNALVDASNGNGLEPSATGESGKDPGDKIETDCTQKSPELAEKKSEKVEESVASTVDEDICPICLEEYDKENPRILTKCEHCFHLACILEWMERSETCPMCDKVLFCLTNDFGTVEEGEYQQHPLQQLEDGV